MPKISFNAGLAPGLEELAGAAPVVVNAVVDAAGAISPRPGIAAYYTGGGDSGEIVGLTVWNDMVIYVTSDRVIWALDGTASKVQVSTAVATTKLQGTGRPVFAAGRDILVIAGGGALQKVTGATPAALVSARLSADADAPAAATHVAALGQRLVANDTANPGNFKWSNIGEGSWATWDSDAVADAEVRPDNVVAIYENSRELYLFGRTTLQIHEIGADPNSPFALAIAINIGISAAHSPVRVDSAFAWLDENRRFMLGDGRQLASISDPMITATLGGLGTVSDCWGFRRRVGAQDHLVWVFPTEELTFAFDLAAKRWHKEAAFSGGQYVAPDYGAAAFWETSKLYLVGSASGAGVAKFSADATTDLGSEIVCEVTTGFDDGGSSARKRCSVDRYAVRRGEAAFGSSVSAGTVPRFEVRHRDDLGTWSEWRAYDLGAEGDYETDVADWGARGVYRRRQRALRTSADISLAYAESFFEGDD